LIFAGASEGAVTATTVEELRDPVAKSGIKDDG
jgi:hypothetical protein